MIETILKFWFDPDNNQQPLYNRAKWWQKSDKTDQFIINKFSDIRMQATQGALDHWLETPKGTLAYIILIDQFSRNIFRDTSAMYEYDNLALHAAKVAVGQEHDKSLSLTHRVYIYICL